jgi:hypothetical protein
VIYYECIIKKLKLDNGYEIQWNIDNMSIFSKDMYKDVRLEFKFIMCTNKIPNQWYHTQNDSIQYLYLYNESEYKITSESFKSIRPSITNIILDPDELSLSDSDKDDIRCCICTMCLHNAKYVCSQNHSVCGLCSSNINKCPLCREQHYIQRSNYEVMSKIDNLIIQCHICKDHHELVYPCQVLCKICNKIIKRKSMVKHFKLHTTYCGFCGIVGRKRGLNYHHNHECNGTVKCLNCYDDYVVCQKYEHDKICLKTFGLCVTFDSSFEPRIINNTKHIVKNESMMIIYSIVCA